MDATQLERIVERLREAAALLDEARGWDRASDCRKSIDEALDMLGRSDEHLPTRPAPEESPREESFPELSIDAGCGSGQAPELAMREADEPAETDTAGADGLAEHVERGESSDAGAGVAASEPACEAPEEPLCAADPPLPTDTPALDTGVAADAPVEGDGPERALRPGEIPERALAPGDPPPIRLYVEIGRNARAGEAYDEPIRVKTFDGLPAQIDRCEIPEASGVHYCDGALRAESPVAGDYRVRLTCTLAGDRPVSGLAAEALLVVNPNPKSLWKSIPSDRDTPGWKPDTWHTGLAGAGGRRIVAASVRGRSHAHVGLFRDDDAAVHTTGADGWNLLAVADGAGSAERSRIGSRVAVDTAVRVLAEKIEAGAADELTALFADGADHAPGAARAAYPLLAAAAFEAVKAIEERARTQQRDPRDYATTLLLAAHRPLPAGELVATYWIGDGAICLLTEEGQAELLMQPDGGDYAGQTRFLEADAVRTGEDIMARIRVRHVPRLEALLLMTDGVSDPRFPSNAALRDSALWAELWKDIGPAVRQADGAAQLCEWLGFWSVGHHDDRTLAAVL